MFVTAVRFKLIFIHAVDMQDSIISIQFRGSLLRGALVLSVVNYAMYIRHNDSQIKLSHRVQSKYIIFIKPYPSPE